MIVAMLRVKNEARWLAEVLEALRPVCERLFVMDDHSTDETPRIAAAHGAEVFPSPFEGIDEARDKDWLLRQVEASCPERSWILCIDGDEVLEPAGVDKIRHLALNPVADAYTFRILYLWDRPDQVRMDGVYGKFYRPSMFRLHQGQTFRRTGACANFHCSSVPADCIGKVRPSDVALLHLGYMDKADRIRKYDWYRKIDPHNSVEDHYRHIVIGDVFPPESRFRHAGPLKLEALHA